MNNSKAKAPMDIQSDKIAVLAARREALVKAHPRYRHWEVLLAVEQDLETCSRYVDICQTNYKSHSIEFSSLILKSCTEIEKLIKRITGAKRRSNFENFIRPLPPLYPEFTFFCVDFPLWNIHIMPWDALRTDPPIPQWWTDYNTIKHDEKEAREAGNLWVCLNAVAGLYVTTLYYDIFTYTTLDTPSIDLEPWMTPKYMQPDSKLVERTANFYDGKPFLAWKKQADNEQE